MAPRMAVATSLLHLTPSPTWPLKSPMATKALNQSNQVFSLVSNLTDILVQFLLVFGNEGSNESVVNEVSTIPREGSHAPGKEGTLEQEVKWKPAEKDV